VSSLGYERITNWGLRELDERAFVQSVLADQPDPPMYFAEMKHLNKVGAPAWSSVPALTLVEDEVLAAAVANQDLMVDVRGHRTADLVPGAIAVPMSSSFSAWAGSVVPQAKAFLIVADDEAQAANARRTLGLIGRSAAIGWSSSSQLTRYQERGGRLAAVTTTDRLVDGYALVDVRSTAEWRAGHLPGAYHAPLARLPERVTGLDRSKPLLVYCQSGVRSTVAATALRRLGFTQVISLAGGLSSYRRHAARQPAAMA
jgi:hydroxyacylglutathione hydrolase